MKKISVALIILILSAIVSADEAKNKTDLDTDFEQVAITNSDTTGSALDIKGRLDIKGELRLFGTSSGHFGLKAARQSGSVTYTLPTNDGSHGQVLSTNGAGTLTWETLNRTVCPAGFSLIGTPASAEAFCISAVQEISNTWLGAITNCYNKPIKSHLCSVDEWTMSCVAGDEGPNNMTGHWEWLSDLSPGYGRIFGLAGCDSFNGAPVAAKYTSRCCFR